MAINMRNIFSKYQLYTVTNYSTRYFLHKRVFRDMYLAVMQYTFVGEIIIANKLYYFAQIAFCWIEI